MRKNNKQKVLKNYSGDRKSNGQPNLILNPHFFNADPYNPANQNILNFWRNGNNPNAPIITVFENGKYTFKNYCCDGELCTPNILEPNTKYVLRYVLIISKGAGASRVYLGNNKSDITPRNAISNEVLPRTLEIEFRTLENEQFLYFALSQGTEITDVQLYKIADEKICPECKQNECPECKQNECPECKQNECPECKQNECPECKQNECNCPKCKEEHYPQTVQTTFTPSKPKSFSWWWLIILVIIIVVLIFRKNKKNN